MQLQCSIETFGGVPCGLDVQYGACSFVLDRRAAVQLRGEIDRFLAAIDEKARGPFVPESVLDEVGAELAASIKEIDEVA